MRYGCYLGISLDEKMYESLSKKLIDDYNRSIVIPEPVRGCNHKIKITDKFCSECGKEAFIVSKIEQPMTRKEFSMEEFELPTLEYFHESSTGIGYPIYSMINEETLKEFKSRTSRALKDECNFVVETDELKFFIESCGCGN